MKSLFLLMILVPQLLMAEQVLFAFGGVSSNIGARTINIDTNFIGSAFANRKVGVETFVDGKLNISLFGLINGTTKNNINLMSSAKLSSSGYLFALGDSFTNVSTLDGIQMHSEAGKNPVFQSYSLSEPGGAGVLATYINFQPTEFQLAPWPLSTSTLHLKSKQKIIKAQYTSKQQVAQNLRTVFINRHCINEKKQNQGLNCHFSWNTQVYIKGINSSNDPVLLIDPAQNNLTVITGEISRAKKLNLWTDHTVHSSSNDTASAFDEDVHLSMTWNQAYSMLSYVTSKSGLNPAAIWGSQWNNPTQWFIQDIGGGQEIYNSDPLNQPPVILDGYMISLMLISA